MPERLALRGLARALERSGVTRSVIERMMLELDDHYTDLVQEAAQAGFDAAAAEAYAVRALGDQAALADVVCRQAVLLHWSVRHPWVAACGRSMCSAVALPFVPVVYCAQRRDTLARWSLSFGLASMITASMLLALCSLFPS